jgi:hypothetical protein
MTFMDENMPEIRCAFCLAASQRDAIPGRRDAVRLRSLEPTPLNIRAEAFTLVELMISIVLVLVLMVGIGKIFKLTSDTVGGGMAIGTMTRGDRASQVTMQNDFAGAASDSPVFMICSERVGAFLTPQDKQSDLDGDPMTVPDSTGKETNSTSVTANPPGSDLSAALYGDRNHRVDRIGFFARGQFNRQTSNDNSSFAASTPSTTSEAYIWYGHLRMNNAAYTAVGNALKANTGGVNDVNYPLPGYKSSVAGQVDNDPNSDSYEPNPIASNWVLGRYAMGLMDFNVITSAFVPSSGNPLYCLVPTTGAPNNVPLAPLGMQTLVTKVIGATNTSSNVTQQNGGTTAPFFPIGGTTNGPCYIYTGRYDLAATTINEFRAIVTSAWDVNQTAGTSPWWWPLVYEGTLAGAVTPPPAAVALRYECNPYVAKPITGTGLAQTVPYFLPHVTQFIVEFAGDYLTQNDPSPPAAGTSGYITNEAPDGKIDFYYDKSADPGGATPSLWVRKIRWYGFPRDISGSTSGGPDGKILSNNADPNLCTDVLPYRDIAAMAAAHTGPPNFETADIPISRTDYAVTNPGNAPGAGVGLAGNEHYYCVWRNAAPKLVRILMKIDDPNGRVRQGRWVEQVFAIQ